jgi:hypothetical protein
MFGSNVPADGVSSSYAVLWNAFKTAGLGLLGRRKGEAVQRYGKTV